MSDLFGSSSGLLGADCASATVSKSAAVTFPSRPLGVIGRRFPPSRKTQASGTCRLIARTLKHILPVRRHTKSPSLTAEQKCLGRPCIQRHRRPESPLGDDFVELGRPPPRRADQRHPQEGTAPDAADGDENIAAGRCRAFRCLDLLTVIAAGAVEAMPPVAVAREELAVAANAAALKKQNVVVHVGLLVGGAALRKGRQSAIKRGFQAPRLSPDWPAVFAGQRRGLSSRASSRALDIARERGRDGGVGRA